MGHLCSADYEAALSYLYDLRDAPSHELAEAMLAGLQRLVPCDLVSFSVMQPNERRFASLDRPNGTCRRVDGLPTLCRLQSQHPLVERYRTMADTSAHRFSDVTSRAQFAKTELYDALYRRLRIEFEMGIFFSLSDRIGAIAVDRCRRDFDERDRELLTLLAPHLRQLCREVAHDGGGEFADRAANGLTRREREIARHAARGLSNNEIAALLGIARGTVKKHLENVYRKTGARNRTASAALLYCGSDSGHRVKERP